VKGAVSAACSADLNLKLRPQPPGAKHKIFVECLKSPLGASLLWEIRSLFLTAGQASDLSERF